MQFEVSIPHIFYAVMGGFIVLVSIPVVISRLILLTPYQFGMFSLLIREKVHTYFLLRYSVTEFPTSYTSEKLPLPSFLALSSDLTARIL